MLAGNKEHVLGSSKIAKRAFWLKKYNGGPGVKVKFNPKNVYGKDPCCCQKGYYTKFATSTIFCWLCNLICARRLFKTASFCKKNHWDKTCTTCQQYGTYNCPEDGVIR